MDRYYIVDEVIKKAFEGLVNEKELQYYCDEAQKIHQNEMILEELEK